MPTKSLRHLFEVSHSGHRRLLAMEGLRGFAVILVFLVHYVTLIQPWLEAGGITFEFARAMFGIGNSGVDLFFVLSGYLIYGTLISKPRPFLRYMGHRIQRIYPTFLAVFILYLILSLLFPDESKLPEQRGMALVYILQNLFLLPGLLDIRPMITVAWSLSYEMFYYITIPILINILGLRSWTSHSRIALFLCLAVAIGVYKARFGGDVRIIMFFAGIVLYDVLAQGHTRRPEKGEGLLALALGLASIWLLEIYEAGGLTRFAVLFVSFYVLCLASIGADGITSQFFSWIPIRWLGNMSYSYYLIHGLTLKAAFPLLSIVHAPTGNETAIFWIALPVMFLLTLLPASVLFACIERPLSLTQRKAIAPSTRTE